MNALRPTLALATLAGLTGTVYFAGLWLGLPFPAILLLLALAAYLHIRNLPADSSAASLSGGKQTFWWLALVGAVAVFVNRSFYAAEVHGGWDAWAIWNTAAASLSDPQHWRLYFGYPSIAHTDYPLCLPANVAFYNRLLPASPELISFGFSFAVMLLIPLLQYADLSRRKVLLPAALLFLWATDEYYLYIGTQQYADGLLALFLLATVMCFRHSASEPRYAAFTGFFLGCACWTKNEGMVLALLFMLFSLRPLVQRNQWRPFLAGMAAPVLLLLLFKMLLAGKNDMLEGHKTPLTMLLLSPERYEIILKSLWEFTLHDFRWQGILIGLYLLLHVLCRRLPGRMFWFLIACMAAYILIYAVTPHNLEWHLQTSQQRLILHLMPALVYVCAEALQLLLPERLQQKLP